MPRLEFQDAENRQGKQNKPNGFTYNNDHATHASCIMILLLLVIRLLLCS